MDGVVQVAENRNLKKGDKKILGHSAIQTLCRIFGNLYTLRDDERSISVNVGGIFGGSGKGNVVPG